MKFGEKFKQQIRSKGMTIDATASLLGVHRQQIFRWMRQKDIRLSTLSKLAKALGVTPQELMSDPEEFNE